MSQKRIYLCLAHMSGNRATLSLRQTMRQRVNKTTSGAAAGIMELRSRGITEIGLRFKA